MGPMPCRGCPAAHPVLTAVACLVIALVALTPMTARAQPAGAASTPLLDLGWSAPDGCPDRAHVVAHVESLVGGRRAGQHSLTARGRITATGGSSPSPRYRLELVVNDAANGAPRTMSGDDCSRLADAAALVLALDIDPDAGTHGDQPPSDAPENEPEPIDPEVPRLRAPERTPPLRLPRRDAPPRAPGSTHVEGFAGARFLFDSGSLPRPTLGVAAAGALVRGPFALDLQAAIYQSQFTLSGPHHGVGGAYVSLATVGAQACWGGIAGEVDWRGCAGGELGRNGTTGVSIAHPESSASVWTALSAMVRARIWPERVISPTIGLGAVHPLTAPTITIQGFGTVFEPPAALIRLFLGVEAQFF
ncbi:MAG: hypothetical protein JWO86_1037 [Myxococcaceae bacterium]|nr:hypothetical protein [Myxococcaceae bacterium]